jgi:hypothetical protein
VPAETKTRGFEGRLARTMPGIAIPRIESEVSDFGQTKWRASTIAWPYFGKSLASINFHKHELNA